MEAGICSDSDRKASVRSGSDARRRGHFIPNTALNKYNHSQTLNMFSANDILSKAKFFEHPHISLRSQHELACDSKVNVSHQMLEQ